MNAPPPGPAPGTAQAICVHDDGSEHPSDGSLPCAQANRERQATAATAAANFYARSTEPEAIRRSAVPHFMAGYLAALAAPSGPQTPADEGNPEHYGGAITDAIIAAQARADEGEAAMAQDPAHDNLCPLAFPNSVYPVAVAMVCRCDEIRAQRTSHDPYADLAAPPAGVPADRARDEDDGRLRAARDEATAQCRRLNRRLDDTEAERDALAAAVERVRRDCDQMQTNARSWLVGDEDEDAAFHAVIHVVDRIRIALDAQ